MPRYLYGHDYRPPSNVVRNLLVGIIATVILIAFVWITHDPLTFTRLSGIRPEAKNMLLHAEPQSIDATQSALRDKSARH